MTTRFPCLNIEGGLFAADLIDQMADGTAQGQKPVDFKLSPRTYLTDEIAAAWTDARSLWTAFQHRLDRLSPEDTATSTTRDQWMIPLLSLLGYELTYISRAAEVDGQTYAISHRAGQDENAPPVHIVGCRQSLDRRPESGRPRLAPHSLLQEYINRTEHLWGVVTNGYTLRLLRDSQLIRRQAYIEFDIKQMMESEKFSDFAILFRLVHRSRLPLGMEDASECLLEKYYKITVEQGGRVRDHLRDGVEEALKILANGFLHHQRNQDLRERVKDGKLAPHSFYQQLLRLIYRFLFLMVAEERNLITENQAYRDYYSISRLRKLAEIRSSYSDHEDLWFGLQTTFRLFQDEKLSEIFGVPPLNGDLFNTSQTPDIQGISISNREFLTALWNISMYREDEKTPWRRINYAALDVEELGSVYESLLDFQPIFHGLGASGEGRVANSEGKGLRTSITFDLAYGMERKSTGSYYTPPELVNELIKSALVPVMEERINEAQRIARSEWRVVAEEIRKNLGAFHYVYSVIPRLRSLETRDGVSGTSVRTDQEFSKGRTLRNDIADSKIGSIHSSKRSGGLGEREHSRVSSVPSDRQGQSAGIGDPSDSQSTSRPMQQRVDRADAGGSQYPESPDSRTATQPPTEAEIKRLWDSTPLTIRTSLLAEQALLALKVCDPASGSGHFLLAAARRLGRELAKIKTGDDEPAPEQMRLAIRDVITHCIYAVDKNPLAVDLCKVALWMEGHAKGKPLTFLDHRIRCGDSLVGVIDLSVLKEGIPDDAFIPVSGDDRTLAKDLKKRNYAERKGQLTLAFNTKEELTNLIESRRLLATLPDDTPEQVRKKVEAFQRLQHYGGKWYHDQTACHIWTAAFFASLTKENNRRIPTTDALLRYVETPKSAYPPLVAYAEALANRHCFFHWPLEFPEILAPNNPSPLMGDSPSLPSPSMGEGAGGGGGGFDVILCNPPWERIKLQEQEFFASKDPDIANAPNKSARQHLIQQLPETNPNLWNEYNQALHDADAQSKFLRQSERFKLTARGDINTYSVFAELFTNLVNPSGRVGVVIPTGIATDDTNKFFFSHLVENKRLASLYDFENREKLFRAVDSRYKFSLLTLRGPKDTRMEPSEFAFFLTNVTHLRDEQRIFTLTADDFNRLNPNTKTCPVFRTKADAELTKKIYERVPVLVNEKTSENPWGVRFRRIFDMNKVEILKLCKTKLNHEISSKYVPMYEAKMFFQYDHRFGSYELRGEERGYTGLPENPIAKYMDPSYRIKPFYWIERTEVEKHIPLTWNRSWLIGFRNITNATNERTTIFSILPYSGTDFSIRLLFPSVNPRLVTCLLANLNSIVFDYVARQNLGGTNLSDYITKQLPILSPDGYMEVSVRFIRSQVMELVYTAWDIKPFADDVWRDADDMLKAEIKKQCEENRTATGGHEWNPPEWAEIAEDGIPLPPFKRDENRRAVLRAELDAYYAKLYGLTRKQLRYILDPADLTEKELKDILDPWEEVKDPLDPEGYAKRVEKSTFPGETFRVLKEKEIRQYGEYRTRHLVLEAWDRLE